MKTLLARIRRLDGALADLAVTEPMLLTELDGFLTSVLVDPEPIAPSEWLEVVWGVDRAAHALDGIAPWIVT